MSDTPETSNRKIAKAAAWTTGAVIAIRVFFFISSIITARLLTPEDFGLIGIAGTVYMLIDTASVTGIGSFLIYKQDLTEEERNTAFTINCVISVLFGLLVILAGFLVAGFYHQPKIHDILFYSGIAFLVSTLGTIPRSLLIKEMKQPILATIDTFANSVNLVLIIVLAFCGFKYLSYVIPLMVSQALCAILLFICARQSFKPFLDLGIVKKMFRYSRSFALQTFLADILYQADYLIGSFFLSSVMMGFYYFGFEKAFLSSILTRKISEQVFFPVFAQLQKEPDALKARYFKLTSYFMFLLFPLFFIVIFLAGDLLTLVYSDRWDNSIFTFQCILGYSMLKMTYDTSITLFNAIGRSDQNLKHFLTVTPHTLLFFAVGVSQGGLPGLAIAAFLAHSLSTVVMMTRLKQHFGWPFREQLLQVASALLPLAAILPVLLGIKYLLVKLGLHPLVIMGNIAVIFFCLYIAFAKCFNSEILDGCWGILQKRLLTRLKPLPVNEI